MCTIYMYIYVFVCMYVYIHIYILFIGIKYAVWGGGKFSVAACSKIAMSEKIHPQYKNRCPCLKFDTLCL